MKRTFLGVVISLGAAWLSACESSDGKTSAGHNENPAGCTTSVECGEGGVCDTSRHVCVTCVADSDCNGQQRCVDNRCVATPCVPDQTRCSADQKQVLSCKQSGAAELSHTCADGQVCIAGTDGARCTDWSCIPGTFSCGEGAVLICQADGATWNTYQTCKASEYCDARRALCVSQVCLPKSSACDGANIVQCNAAGSELAITATCSLSELCLEGACHEIACVPNTKFCRDGSVWRCGGDGTTSAMVTHCGTDQYCLERENDAECSNSVCHPGDPICVGNIATECKPDGSGPKPGGDDCSASGELCYAGECRDRVCTEGQKLCNHDDVYLCIKGGTDVSLLSDCSDSEVCDPAMGACRKRICQPGTLNCDGTRITTCNATGTGYTQSGTDCASKNQICDAGSCKDVVCTAGRYFCKDGAVHTCNAAGTNSTLYSECGSTSHCEPNSWNGAGCTSNICTPNQPACNANFLSTCNADGSGFIAGGSDCTLAGNVCVDAKCVPKICEPNRRFCADGDVQICNSSGSAYSEYSYCLSDTYCKVDGASASCVKKPCTPGAITCYGEKLGECTADGMGVSDTAQDCALKDQVCTAAGCADSATEVLGSAVELRASNYTVIGDFIDVYTPRVVTSIEAYLQLPATRNLRWLIYEKYPAYPELRLKMDKLTTASSTGFHSSGALNFTLEANKTYAIAVAITSGSYIAYWNPISSPQRLSFGQAAGSFTSYFATSLSPSMNPNELYNVRLVTTLP